MLSSILAWLKSYGVFIVILVALVVIAWQADVIRKDQLAAQQALNAVLVTEGQKLQAVQGQLDSTNQIINTLGSQLAAVVAQLQKAGATPTEHVSDQPTVTEVTTLTPVGSISNLMSVSGIWTDSHKRFTFSLPSGTFDSNQKFTYEAVIVTSADGTTKLLKDEFYEVDPTTGEIIPEAKVQVSPKFQFTKDPGEVTPMLHLRLLGGIDQTASAVLGAEVLNLEALPTPVLRNATFSVLGIYDGRNSQGKFVGMLGYNVFGNIVIGPYYGITTKAQPTLGGALVVRLTN